MLLQKGSADLAFLYSGVWVRPASRPVESSGESLPTPVSAISLEAVIIGEFAYGTTVASDSSISGIIRGQRTVPSYNHLGNHTAMVTPTRKVGKVLNPNGSRTSRDCGTCWARRP